MMNDKQKELIQAGVDGELDADGRKRLERLLEHSEEARTLHEDLQRLTTYLERVPGVEPDAGLHGAIVDGIQLRQPSRFRSLFSFGDLPGFLRYGLAATAAVVLTVAVYRGGGELEGSADYADMVGTIARGGPVAGATELDRFRFDHPEASGQVRLIETDGVYALEFELRSGEPVQFDVDFTGNGLVFDAFAQRDHHLEAVSWSDNVLSARTSGDQRFVVLMRRSREDAEAGSKIGLEISRQGEAIESGWLEPDW